LASTTAGLVDAHQSTEEFSLMKTLAGRWFSLGAICLLAESFLAILLAISIAGPYINLLSTGFSIGIWGASSIFVGLLVVGIVILSTIRFIGDIPWHKSLLVSLIVGISWFVIPMIVIGLGGPRN
jgi:hypothetical protein